MIRTIKKISTKDVETKYGTKGKYNIQFEDDTWIDSFAGNWNQNWKVGDEIEFSKDQIEEREYKGKKYYTLKAPPEAKFSGVGRDEFDALEARVRSLETDTLEDPEPEPEPGNAENPFDEED